jgi:hypothetical protein
MVHTAPSNADMRKQFYNLIAAAMVLAFGLQAVVPASAMILISMRCAGHHATASAGAAPCASAVVPADQTALGPHAMVSMAACRATGLRCPMMSAVPSMPATGSRISPSPCFVTVTSFGMDRLAIAAIRDQRLGLDGAVIAVPSALLVMPSAGNTTCAISLASRILPHRDTTASNGLRAPPSA